MTVATSDHSEKPKVFFMNDPKIRGIIFQVLLVLIVGFILYSAASNAIENLQRQKIASGFGFFSTKAGFGITQTLIHYTEDSTYLRAAVAGLLNTMVVAIVGVILATLIGFIVGVARLSKNKLLSFIATSYVELLRNTPLLLQLIFWYMAVLQPLPGPKNSVLLADNVFVNNRGLFIPQPEFLSGSIHILSAFLVALGITIWMRNWARKREEATGQPFPVFLTGLALLVLTPLFTYLLLGRPVHFNLPTLQGFNITGGMRVIPEFVALLLGLVMYTAAFIAEIVRAGILAVSKGQTEASYALGLRPSQTLNLVIVPQALRVIIPPLTNQYLNLTKNSTLAVSIGYPDFVQVYTGTVLNQTGQALEIVATTMMVYLLISLSTSAFMNWYNSKIALVER